MNLDNFVVRPQRRLVEQYAEARGVGRRSTTTTASELAHEVAGLPSELEPEDEEAKRFDLLMLNLQLAVLRAEPAFERLREQVKAIAGLLEEKASIPMVQRAAGADPGDPDRRVVAGRDDADAGDTCASGCALW